MLPPQTGQALVVAAEVGGLLLHQVAELAVVPLDLLLLLLVPLGATVKLLILFLGFQKAFRI